jgi:hypothetical protein
MGGRIYWSDKQVRVWTNNGSFLDLGKRSLESARTVAVALGYRLIIQGASDSAERPALPGLMAIGEGVNGRVAS